MICFIDTSALLALLDADDRNHIKAKKQWESLVYGEASLICTNYVLIESFALMQYRLGLKAIAVFQDDIVPILTVEWVDEFTHQEGVTAVLTAARKKLSLVDCVSFAVMRRLGLKTAFAFDKHFRAQGFQCIP